MVCLVYSPQATTSTTGLVNFLLWTILFVNNAVKHVLLGWKHMYIQRAFSLFNMLREYSDHQNCFWWNQRSRKIPSYSETKKNQRGCKCSFANIWKISRSRNFRIERTLSSTFLVLKTSRILMASVELVGFVFFIHFLLLHSENSKVLIVGTFYLSSFKHNASFS